MEKKEKKEEHFVYMLYSPSTKRTYTGYTNKIPTHRLRKHNGEIQGGAKATKRGRPWVLVFYLEGFPSQVEALRFEWRTHHPFSYLSKEKRKEIVRGWGYKGRIESICSILCMDKVCSKAECMETLTLSAYWVDKDRECPEIFIKTMEGRNINFIIIN